MLAFHLKYFAPTACRSRLPGFFHYTTQLDVPLCFNYDLLGGLTAVSRFCLCPLQGWVIPGESPTFSFQTNNHLAAISSLSLSWTPNLSFSSQTGISTLITTEAMSKPQAPGYLPSFPSSVFPTSIKGQLHPAHWLRPKLLCFSQLIFNPSPQYLDPTYLAENTYPSSSPPTKALFLHSIFTDGQWENDKAS